jgi:hypothetical protein
MFPVYGGKCLSRKAAHKWIEKYFADDEEVETEVRKWLRQRSRLLCCGLRRTDKAMGQVYQCWSRNTCSFSRFEYMFYVLYPFVACLLTLLRMSGLSKPYHPTPPLDDFLVLHSDMQWLAYDSWFVKLLMSGVTYSCVRWGYLPLRLLGCIFRYLCWSYPYVCRCYILLMMLLTVIYVLMIMIIVIFI